MPEDNIWNRNLFEIPRGLKILGHKICVGWFFLYWAIAEWMVLTSYPKFGLVTEHTSIPGFLAFAVSQISAAVGLWSIYCFASKRFEPVRHVALTTSGISVFSWMFIGRPEKFLRANVEEYASAYPFFFGVTCIFTALCLGALVLITFRPSIFQIVNHQQENMQ